MVGQTTKSDGSGLPKLLAGALDKILALESPRTRYVDGQTKIRNLERPIRNFQSSTSALQRLR